VSSPSPEGALGAAPLSNEPLSATIVVRSYNRLDACCEAVERCLEQDYPAFDVLVLEQSTRTTPDQVERLEALARRDARVRIERRPPLGGPGSRNEACRVAGGDVILMLDDDDLPAHRGWLAAHMRNFADPRCLAVTGRHIYEHEAEPSPGYMRRGRRRVLRYSFLKWQHIYCRTDRRSEQIESIHGTNSAIRRTTLERFGTWDTCTRIEDESSLCYRILAGRRPGEYMVFDPEAAIVRRLDLEGGLDKRQLGPLGYAHKLFVFFHNIVGHYHRGRFVAFYPAYLTLCWWKTLDWLWNESSAHRGRTGRKLGAAAWLTATLPLAWWGWLAGHVRERLRDGPPPRAERLPPREVSPVPPATE
jgi:glycosyltransferase involved in cell wall biosynthesis